jgi:hypothetical protein
VSWQWWRQEPEFDFYEGCVFGDIATMSLLLGGGYLTGQGIDYCIYRLTHERSLLRHESMQPLRERVLDEFTGHDA